VSKPSKFQGIFQNRLQEEPVTSEDEREVIAAEPIDPETALSSLAQPLPRSIDPNGVEQAIVDKAPIPKKMGRPAGKRSDPEFTQVTAYIRSQTYRDVKVALLMAEDQQEFSQLMETLLSEWLSTQKSR
jgi:hypothetical protein